LGIINFEAGVKLSGTRFYVLEGAGARLERALIFWMVDQHIRQGYHEVYPPYMVRHEVMFASGSCPSLLITFITMPKRIFGWYRRLKCHSLVC